MIYSSCQMIGWKPSILRKAMCFMQYTNSLLISSKTSSEISRISYQIFAYTIIYSNRGPITIGENICSHVQTSLKTYVLIQIKSYLPPSCMFSGKFWTNY